MFSASGGKRGKRKAMSWPAKDDGSNPG